MKNEKLDTTEGIFCRLNEIAAALGEANEILRHLERRLESGSFGVQLPLQPTSYLTNDCLQVDTRSRVLWINGKSAYLSDREFILVFILAKHAMTSCSGRGEEFMSKADLLEEIDDVYGDVWRYATRDDVDHAVSSLRGKLKKIGISRDLVESPTGKIRLSTPPANITIAKEAIGEK